MSHKIWSKKDKTYLKENWGILACKEIAKKLARTEDSIYKKASEMELRVKDKQGVSCREAEDISGFNKGTILKAMINDGITENEWKRLTPKKIEKLVENIMQYESMSSVCKRHGLTKYQLKQIIDYYRVSNYSETRVMKLKSGEIDEAIEKYKKRRCVSF